jgi:hypothetical protein
MRCGILLSVRTVSNSLLAGLIVAALFWGNCFSCPQLLASLAERAPHSCCHRSAPVSRDACTTSALRHFVKADGVAMAAPAVAPAAVSAFVPAPQENGPAVAFVTPPRVPDLLALTSVIRI